MNNDNIKHTRIAILGATSHIAKGLICNFLKSKGSHLFLYARNSARVSDFMQSIDASLNKSYEIEQCYDNFQAGHFDVVVNCIGIGTPRSINNNYSDWFTVTERYDNLVLAYLTLNPCTLYVNFSSGAVYGNDLSSPVNGDTANCIKVNHLSVADYYSIVRIYSEAKHRSYNNLRIVDLRIFAYFSRFVGLDSGYFITDVLNSIKQGNVLVTSGENIVRDYIHPDDLFSLVLKCINARKLNTAIDVASSEPVRKFSILEYFVTKYGLTYEVSSSYESRSPNGAKNVYCSSYNNAGEIGFWPKYTSMDTIMQESEFILGS